MIVIKIMNNIIKLGPSGTKYYMKFLISLDEIVDIYNSMDIYFSRKDVINKLKEMNHGRVNIKSSHIIYFLQSKKLARIYSFSPLKCQKIKNKICVSDLI